MTEAIRRTVQRHRSPHLSLALTYAVLAFLLLETETHAEIETSATQQRQRAFQ